MECTWAHAHAHTQGTDLALIAGALHDRGVLDADLVRLVVSPNPPPPCRTSGTAWRVYVERAGSTGGECM
jgi:hypothetical protein